METLTFQEIGAFDAKAKLSELLRSVRAGHSYTITIRGEAVANLVPSTTAAQSTQAAIASMLAFKKIPGVTSEDISDWIQEGRR